MERHVKYRMKAGLKIAGAFLLLCCFASCGSYKVLNIDVLQPGEMNLGPGNVQVLFVDRKIIHEADSLSALQLYTALRLRRDDIVNCFYDGLRAALRSGVRPILMVKGLGLTPTYVPDGYEPKPISPAGINELKKITGLTHVLAVEYCKFGIDASSRLTLDSNLLVRLYDVEGNVVHSVRSDKLDALEHMRVGTDDYATICNFFYDCGVDYAERMTPTWKPEERRLYTGNRVLDLGFYYFDKEDTDEARRIWSAALNLKPKVAAKAAVNLAWLYEQEGNFSGAKALLEAALKTLGQSNANDKLSVYIKTYIDRLDKRIKDETKIMEQI